MDTAARQRYEQAQAAARALARRQADLSADVQAAVDRALAALERAPNRPLWDQSPPPPSRA